MELKEQVISLELAKRLKELNCRQESIWWWVFPDFGMAEPTVVHLNDRKKIYPVKEYPISAFTVAELGKMLPDGYATALIKGEWFMGSIKLDHKWATTGIRTNTEVNAKAEMLIYLIENKLLNAE